MKKEKTAATGKFKFTKEGGFGSAMQIGNKPKKGELLEIVGWVIGMSTLTKDHGTKKKPDVRHSHKFTLALPEGGKQDVWGGGAINNVLLDNPGEKNAKLKKDFKNVLVQFKFVGMLKAKPGQNPGRNIEVGTDRTVKLPAEAGRIAFAK